MSLSGLLELYAPYDEWDQWQDVRREFSECKPEAQWDHPVCDNFGNGVEMIEGDYNVPVQQVTSDDDLVASRVRFRTNGSAVHIVYESGCCVPDGIRPKREGGRAILNAFELISTTGAEVAALPDPADGEQEAPRDTILKWVSGASAVWHNVYIGADETAVRNAGDPNTPPGRGRAAATEFDPGILSLDTTYYWRVDEVNSAEPESPWRGELWSFTTKPCADMERFESYEDSAGLRNSWSAGGGAWIELAVEQYHGGEKSVQLDYYNKSGFKHSELTYVFGKVQDWATNVEAIGLFFKGSEGNDADTLYVTITDAAGNVVVVPHKGDVGDIRSEQWQPMAVYLDELSGVDLSAVKQLSLGVGDPKGVTASKAAGTVFFDDVALCVPSCIEETRITGDFVHNCRVDFGDFAVMAGEWLERENLSADITGDDKTNLRDLRVLLANWLKEELWP